MKVIDFTHTISTEMPVYPGSESPIVKKVHTIEANHFNETLLKLSSHTGTHIDAPLHMQQKSQGLENFDVNQFVGKASIIDVTKMKSNEITVQDLIIYENLIKELDFLIFYTGWNRFWGADQYFKDYPALTIEAAKWLSQFQLKGVGVDTISIDHGETNIFSVHHTFFDQNMIIIENLTNLEKVKERTIFDFYCLPLKYTDADGSPVRAIGII